ncbi:uncharacterized protein CELE_Y82E9BL.6 [Caenorhabditis elegans]|uniref:Uncharacterized protein n=1 Tax=Caenorhabditis elegans TaxID=6239 RepID=Q95XB4_CAEEL|nr:Uncharacterized protein CELE_Y82E9BL.6 [Caenorhabditis elegans]CCD73892.1 Uncharacterized protein CELE_Y82E9BL.6 [Caenorhabditis elegans]|eukprot:NP_497388.1 Uncharacterized protein CELE_Y82E9BL.6 [Caenorhabditis elegans]
MGAVGRILHANYLRFLVYFIYFTYELNVIIIFKESTFLESTCFIIPFSLGLSYFWIDLQKIDKQMQQSIENFCWYRILIAGAVVCLNVLFPVVMILMFLGGWMNILAFAVIHSLLVHLPIGFANILLESESPIKYTFPKTTQLTNLQKVSIFTFFAIMEAYYIYLCTWTHPSQNEFNIINKLWPETIYLCPIIKIMSIPAVIIACYAHNSAKINLSRLRPDGGLELIEIRTWNPTTRIWGVDEKPEEHGVFEV